MTLTADSYLFSLSFVFTICFILAYPEMYSFSKHILELGEADVKNKDQAQGQWEWYIILEQKNTLTLKGQWLLSKA